MTAATDAARRARPLPPNRTVGALACGVGVVGMAAVVGVAGPHLAKTGVTPVAIGGVACLAAGVVLTIRGARAMLRERRWWVAVPSIVGLVLLAGVALLTVGQGVAATNVPPTTLGTQTPAAVGLDYRAVEVTTDDGVTLSAWYIPSASGAAVVLRHGAGSTRTDVLDHAAVLARHGYGVLMMDARGHGLSGGTAMDFGWYGDPDLSAGVDLLVAQPGVDADRIGAVGLSMGGEEAIGAASHDPRVRAVVAEGATTRTPEDKAWMPDAYGLAGTIQQQLDKVTYAVADLLTPASPPIPLRRAAELAAPRAILLIAGGAVEDEPPSAMAIQAGSPETVSVWVIPAAGHVGGLASQPLEWERRVTGFLDAELGAPGGGPAPR